MRPSKTRSTSSMLSCWRWFSVRNWLTSPRGVVLALVLRLHGVDAASQAAVHVSAEREGRHADNQNRRANPKDRYQFAAHSAVHAALLRSVLTLAMLPCQKKRLRRDSGAIFQGGSHLGHDY